MEMELWAGLSDERAGCDRYKTRSRAAAVLATAMPLSGRRRALPDSEVLRFKVQLNGRSSND